MNQLVWHYAVDSAEHHPGNLAVAGAKSRLTYEELALESDRGAGLLHELGVRKGDRVAVLLPKSIDAVVAMQAASKLGAVYVPIDYTSPPTRAAYIADDCGVTCLVTTERAWRGVAGFIQKVQPALVLLDGDCDGSVSWSERERAPYRRESYGVHENQPAYILYTSGSTGRPKGVVISHRNSRAFADWGMKTFGLTGVDRLSGHAPLHFDLSVFDLYCAWAAAASVHLVESSIGAFPAALSAWIESEGITTWYSVPSALIRLHLRGDLGDRRYPELRTVLFAGEVFPIRHLRAVMEALPGADFFNLYGPTETNVISYHGVTRPLRADVESIPIGQACDYCELVVEREDGETAGPGESGESLAGGATVMLGYWGLSEQTADVLQSDPRPEACNSVLYRTGDLVRVGNDGRTLTFLGRRDHMVKTRGYRVELAEVERALLSFEKVREAAVVAVPDEEFGATLRGFVVAEVGETLSQEEMVAHCLDHLPRYAVPENWDFPDALPMTSRGKVDRVALTQEAN